MQKNKGKILIVVFIIVLLGVLLIHKMGAKSSESVMEQLGKLTESKAYTVEVLREDGQTQEIGEINQTRLLELIAALVQPVEGEELPEDTPQLIVHILGEDPKTDIQLTIYDEGEETDIGLLQNKDQKMVVQNCGEVFNYLAELGFVTQR